MTKDEKQTRKRRLIGAANFFTRIARAARKHSNAGLAKHADRQVGLANHYRQEGC